MIAGKECYLYMGSSYDVGYFYTKSTIIGYEPMTFYESYEKYMFLGEEVEKREAFWEDAKVWVEGFDYPFNSEKVFFDLPFSEGKDTIFLDGEKHILTPLERWVRIPSRQVLEVKYIRNLEIEKLSFYSGSVGNISEDIIWRCNGLVIGGCLSWEEAYSAFASSLAVQRFVR